MSDQETLNDVTCGVVSYKSPLSMRIWKFLGFRYSAHAPRPEDDEAQYCVHRVLTYWDWRDRLRILVTGSTETKLCVETKQIVLVKVVRTHSVVLAPGAWPPHAIPAP